ncbi:ATP phosphoribosyltransferase regulatory subunit [Bacillus sp. 1NLA3E]|uniref:ATP phosphoribosyltransferase regulatory subunit n=1 Tax=Bacillus sp. 1NLA3E TaxID=666686 RepID=UPI000247EE54|nr:ATP phosphoribosyltransferase regulatory subunit [Bacillus sp. 1NLA3E]AGK55618.1 ATP phosphoribosyltransferase regulatory subunit [Bacillus sp. 1NLA3E]
MSLFMFEKPLGMRDTLPDLYETKQRVKRKIAEEMKRWGYQFVQTPTLEYFDTVGSASAILDGVLFKLLDQQGHTLVLRPDMTAPIARVAVSKLLNDDLPLRLASTANLFRAQQREGGRPAEFEQIGVECIADDTMSADAEVIALMISSLKEAGLKDFQISVGHIGFVQDLFMQILGTEERTKTLTKFLYEKNYVGYREHVKALPLSSIDKQRLFDLLQLRGGEEVIENALSLIENEQGRNAIQQLRQLWDIVSDYGVETNVKFDLTLVSHMSYYTGILFELYAGKVGFPIGSGGRYDRLLEKFGKPTGATGFAVRVDRLLEALGELEKPEPIECILFSEERRKEAFQLANQKRAEGQQVILQDINGVKNVDSLTNKFADTILLIGKQERGSAE